MKQSVLNENSAGETWWETSPYTTKIKSLQVEKSTDSSIWIGNRRHARITEYTSYFPSYADARQHLLNIAQDKVERAQRHLEIYQKRLADVQAIPPLPERTE